MPCDPPPTGIVSWWPAEGSANDIVGNNNGISVRTRWLCNGEVGQAFSFDGNGDGVQVADATNLQLQDFTIETWIKRASASVVSYGSGGNPVIFGYGTGAYIFFMSASGNLNFSQEGNFNYCKRSGHHGHQLASRGGDQSWRHDCVLPGWLWRIRRRHIMSR